jgi:hypothetical protein
MLGGKFNESDDISNWLHNLSANDTMRISDKCISFSNSFIFIFSDSITIQIIFVYVGS